jgi:hypothetical protein
MDELACSHAVARVTLLAFTRIFTGTLKSAGCIFMAQAIVSHALVDWLTCRAIASITIAALTAVFASAHIYTNGIGRAPPSVAVQAVVDWTAISVIA